MSTKPTDGHPTPVDRVNPESLNSPAGLFPVAFVVISRSSPRVTPLPLVIFVWPIPVPINEIANRWIGNYEQHRLQALDDLKKALEGDTHG